MDGFEGRQFPHGKWKHRWTDSYEADHGAEGHHVNALTNMTLRHKRKHRSLSGQESARVKSVRRAEVAAYA